MFWKQVQWQIFKTLSNYFITLAYMPWQFLYNYAYKNDILWSTSEPSDGCRNPHMVSQMFCDILINWTAYTCWQNSPAFSYIMFLSIFLYFFQTVYDFAPEMIQKKYHMLGIWLCQKWFCSIFKLTFHFTNTCSNSVAS